MKLEDNLLNQKNEIDNMKHDFINFQTQIKILSVTLGEKCENIKMLDNELDNWKLELNREKIDHYNSRQNISALEFKIEKISNKEKKKN
jgi:hypothetical protein